MRGRMVRSLMVGALAGLLAAATGAARERRARRRDRNQGWSAIDPGFRLPSPDPGAIDPRFHLPPSRGSARPRLPHPAARPPFGSSLTAVHLRREGVARGERRSPFGHSPTAVGRRARRVPPSP